MITNIFLTDQTMLSAAEKLLNRNLNLITGAVQHNIHQSVTLKPLAG